MRVAAAITAAAPARPATYVPIGESSPVLALLLLAFFPAFVLVVSDSLIDLLLLILSDVLILVDVLALTEALMLSETLVLSLVLALVDALVLSEALTLSEMLALSLVLTLVDALSDADSL